MSIWKTKLLPQYQMWYWRKHYAGYDPWFFFHPIILSGPKETTFSHILKGRWDKWLDLVHNKDHAGLQASSVSRELVTQFTVHGSIL